MSPVIAFLKENWMAIVGALVVIAIMMIFMSMRKEKYYDYEMTGCSTCSAGDAGVLIDSETEMYQMPDDYYSDAEEEVLDDGTEDAEEGVAFDEDILFSGVDEEEAGMDADMVFAEQVVDGGIDGEEDADMVFAEQVMDGGIDGEEDDLDLLEIDELDAEEDDYSEL